MICRAVPLALVLAVQLNAAEGMRLIQLGGVCEFIKAEAAFRSTSECKALLKATAVPGSCRIARKTISPMRSQDDEIIFGPSNQELTATAVWKYYIAQRSQVPPRVACQEFSYHGHSFTRSSDAALQKADERPLNASLFRGLPHADEYSILHLEFLGSQQAGSLAASVFIGTRPAINLPTARIVAKALRERLGLAPAAAHVNFTTQPWFVGGFPYFAPWFLSSVTDLRALPQMTTCYVTEGVTRCARIRPD